jgi:hypothetical protein
LPLLLRGSCILLACGLAVGCAGTRHRPPPQELDEAAKADAERSALAFACAVKARDLKRAQAWAAYLMGYNAGLAEEDIQLSKDYADKVDAAGVRLTLDSLDCRGVEIYPELHDVTRGAPAAEPAAAPPADPYDQGVVAQETEPAPSATPPTGMPSDAPVQPVDQEPE